MSTPHANEPPTQALPSAPQPSASAGEPLSGRPTMPHAGPPSAPPSGPPAGSPSVPPSGPPRGPVTGPPGGHGDDARSGPPLQPASTTGTDPMDRFFGWLRGLGIYRRTDDKWIGGVASGIADRLRVDPVIVRAGFIVLALFVGFGITLYLLAWTFLPNRNNEINAERAVRHGDGGSIVLLVITGFALFSGFPWWVGPDNFGWSFPWGLLIVGGLIWWAVSRSRARQSPAERADWDRRAAAWGQDVETRVTAWGDQVNQRAAQVGDHRDDAGGRRDGGTQPSSYRPGGSAQAYGPGAPGYGPGSPAYGPGATSPAYGSFPPPAAGATAMAPVLPVVPPIPRRRSGGFLMTLVALGLALVTYGATLWGAGRYNWSGDHEFIAFSASLGTLGLLILGLGLAGWRAGFVGFLAVVAAVMTFLAGVFPAGSPVGGKVGDETWAPMSLGTNQTYRLSIGDGQLDLTNLPVDGLTGQRIAVSLGVGELTVRVPEGLTVEVDGRVGIGNVNSPADQGSRDNGGAGVQETNKLGDGPTEVFVKANVGLGQLTLVKE